MTLNIVYVALRVGMILALYAFLLFALFTLWKDLSLRSESVAGLPEAFLVPAQEEGELPSFHLESVNLVGRSSGNTIRLDDPSVSATHARLSHQYGQWWLEDLGSTNGTMVNQLVLSEPLVVTYGDLIHFGKLGFKMVRHPERSDVASGPATEAQSG
jgi:hypothetical protein